MAEKKETPTTTELANRIKQVIRLKDEVKYYKELLENKQKTIDALFKLVDELKSENKKQWKEQE